MFKVDLDMSDISWITEEYKKEHEEWVESELDSIMESCEDSAECYVNESDNSMEALRVVRDNQTSYDIYNPTNEFVIGVIWYQATINI